MSISIPLESKNPFLLLFVLILHFNSISTQDAPTELYKYFCVGHP